MMGVTLIWSTNRKAGTMDTSVIIGQFSTGKGLPRAALLAAAEQRQELAPLFIGEINRYLLGADSDRPSPEALFFMFHLLGDWRETSAYPALARLLRQPGDEVEEILGDGVTETSHRVMAAVFDGDPQPIYDIILDPYADEYIRSRMCETLAMLVWQGKLDRPVAACFLRDCFMHLQPQAENCVWEGWRAAVVMLGLKELSSIVEKVFRRGYISRHWSSFHDFEEDLQRALAAPGVPPWESNRDYTLFGDTLEELSWWHGFSEEGRREREKLARQADRFWTACEPAVNPHRGVGRNDPCPCGSGTKYKKCCLH
jgi:hypothetical protein